MRSEIIHLSIYSVTLVLSCLLTACQRPAADIVHETKEAPKSEKTTPDLTQICQNLKQEMRDMNAQRTTLAIEQVNQDIRLCLPLIKFPEQKELMNLSKKMYQNFLHLDRTAIQQQAFENYVLDQAAYPTIQQSQFEQLNIRDQYLLRHKGQAYIELIEQDGDQITYRRSPQYLAKVFAPYLPEPEKVFIENLAEQNTQSLLKNNSINLSPDEITKRAIFWQKYSQDYPESTYLSDAKFLKNAYSNLLFQGIESAPISVNFESQSDIDIASWIAIKRLAKSNDGELSKQAEKFQQFINMTTEQRKQKIQLSAKEQNKLENKPQLLLLSQLNQYLNLYPMDIKRAKRDCFSDAICLAS